MEQQPDQHEPTSSPSVDRIIDSFNKNAARKAQKRENLLLAYVMNATERAQRKSIVISRLRRELYESEDAVCLLKMENEAKEELLLAAEEKLRSSVELLKSKDEALSTMSEQLSAMKGSGSVESRVMAELDALKNENQQLKARLKELSCAKAATKSTNTPTKPQTKPEVKHVVVVKPTMSTKIAKFTAPKSPATSIASAKSSDSPSITSLSSVARVAKTPSFSKGRLGSFSSLTRSPAVSPVSTPRSAAAAAAESKLRTPRATASAVESKLPTPRAAAATAVVAPVARTEDPAALNKRSFKKSKETTSGSGNVTGLFSLYNLRKRSKQTK